ncbi:MAG: formate/nitrite transporter family protein [Actinomycetota bacterium]
MTRPPDPGSPVRFLPAGRVIAEMARVGRDRIHSTATWGVLTLGALGGGFITAGALLSVLLASGIGASGPRMLAQGFGFSTGFFFVVLSEAALFTEANVVMPATLMTGIAPAARVVRFWGLALMGNLAGSVVLGSLIRLAHTYDPAVNALLAELITHKMAFRSIGGVGGWTSAVLSGVLANWLVGMAAFFATMGRTIVGRYIPVLLAVTTFVAAGFQHSPANIGYFSLAMAAGGGPGWGPAILWNLVPAGIGNVLGGTLLVALPFWLLYGRKGASPESAGQPGRWRPG